MADKGRRLFLCFKTNATAKAKTKTKGYRAWQISFVAYSSIKMNGWMSIT
ncbi:MAG: hypothetical protein N2V76_04470 [Methanophagales archaeon]|nr:hypothetical protein [Methanophagales archaeon]